MRAKKLKMPGGEISVLCHKTAQSIKDNWAQMIESGKLTIGEPCAPYTLTRCAVVEGKVQQTQVQVYGRKFPLTSKRPSYKDM